MSVLSGLDVTSRRRIVAAVSCAAVGLFVADGDAPPLVMLVGLGVGLTGASIMLAWAADAGEVAFSGRLVLATVALIAILPEFTVAAHFAYTGQTALVTVNLSGSTTLMLTAATAMPIIVGWLHRRRDTAECLSRGEIAAQPTPLSAGRRVDLATLSIAALVTLQAAARGDLTMLDGAVLVGLWVLHIRRIHATTGEQPAVIGVAAALAALPMRQRRRWIAALAALGGLVVMSTADPFVNALLHTGTSLGIPPGILIQSVLPLATEAPELLTAAMLARHHRPAQGIAVLLAASVGQSTLALGGLPVAYALGGHGATLPLAGPDQAALFLTIATMLFAVAALVTLRPEAIDGKLLLGLYVFEFVFTAPAMRAVAAIVLAVFTIDLLVTRRRALRPMLAALRSPPGSGGVRTRAAPAAPRGTVSGATESKPGRSARPPRSD
jgi:cation:H+ antiporter